MDKDIQERFRITDRLVMVDERRKKESLQILQKCVEDKQMTVLESRRRILFNQIRYMDKSAAGTHALFGVFLLLIVILLHQRSTDKEDIILVSMVLSGVLGVVSVAEIGRIFYPGLAELSESCYFNVRQIVALHMSLAGIVDLTVLGVGIFIVGAGWKMNLMQIGLYVLVPFVFAQVCCLGVLLSEAGRKNFYLLIMVGIFLAVFYMILASVPGLYRISALGVWGTALLAGLLLLGIQIKKLFRGIKRGELLCMN
ncbi:MAG: hypothetical protein NC314_00135 [Roseburia sp.]|nr:hypothetical protein [Roseburia sp.]MCM1241222.1 hypothetical protein [Roseburia sp.]